MSRAVMISIQPKWCELIVNGKKTIEVRKTRPKLEAPFKCYIYCTRRKHKNAFHTYVNSGYGRENFGVIGHWRSGKEIVDVNAHLPACRYNAYLAESKVIGEFVCDRIYQYSTANVEGIDISDEDMEKMSCLNRLELEEYELSAEAKDFEVYRLGLYCWHISDLVIYDKPKELSEFNTSKRKHKSCRNCEHKGWKEMYSSNCDCEMCFEKAPITKPPQSWCYVEEVQA